MKFAEGTDTTSSVFVETDWFFNYAANFLFNTTTNSQNSLSSIDAQFQKFVQNQKAQDYSDLVLFNYPDRKTVYIYSNYDDIQLALIQFGTKITEALGFYAIQLDLPIL